ncbi:MAG: hypothetical protein BWY82_01737 [Verrucomicrobia bacterium ADurb.Bin474]|nr:MAG: hypothetical protein BWY82_01737 [Verrucomicrobia bacterium ADurb.Bin474]
MIRRIEPERIQTTVFTPEHPCGGCRVGHLAEQMIPLRCRRPDTVSMGLQTVIGFSWVQLKDTKAHGVPSRITDHLRVPWIDFSTVQKDRIHSKCSSRANNGTKIPWFLHPFKNEDRFVFRKDCIHIWRGRNTAHGEYSIRVLPSGNLFKNRFRQNNRFRKVGILLPQGFATAFGYRLRQIPCG